MTIERVHAIVDAIAQLIELAGVAVILVGIVAATAAFGAEARRSGSWRSGYQRYRSDLGRGILLGLELLVAADIIATITAPLTFSSVGLLGLIVVIRTFLSFSLETEIEGRLPWRQAERREEGRGEDGDKR